MKKCSVESIKFTPAKGGMISQTELKTERGGQGGGPTHDYTAETTVHPTMDHAVAHMKAKLGHAFKSEK